MILRSEIRAASIHLDYLLKPRSVKDDGSKTVDSLPSFPIGLGLVPINMPYWKRALQVQAKSHLSIRISENFGGGVADLDALSCH